MTPPELPPPPDEDPAESGPDAAPGEPTPGQVASTPITSTPPSQPADPTAGGDAEPVTAHQVTAGLAGDRLPGWARRLLLWVFLGIVLLYYGRGVMSSLRPLFVILLVSMFLSFAIEPAVNRMERLGIRRGLGTWLVFLGILAVVSGFGFAVGTVLADQIETLVDDAPETIDDLEQWLRDNVDEDIDLDDLRDQFLEGGELNRQLTSVAGDLVSFGATLLGLLLQIFTVALFTYYLVAEGPQLRRAVCSLLPPQRQREVLTVWNLAIEKTGGYIASRAVLAFISAVFHWGAFAVLDVPFPLPLALFVGVVSQFIPVVGTYIAGALPTLIALLDDPITGVWVVAFVVVYQQLENYVFAPRITAHTMEIHVAVAFGAVLAGAAILGPVGAVLALPAAATIQAFVSSFLVRHEVVAEVDEGQRSARRRPRRSS